MDILYKSNHSEGEPEEFEPRGSPNTICWTASQKHMCISENDYLRFVGHLAMGQKETGTNGGSTMLTHFPIFGTD